MIHQHCPDHPSVLLTDCCLSVFLQLMSYSCKFCHTIRKHYILTHLTLAFGCKDLFFFFRSLSPLCPDTSLHPEEQNVTSQRCAMMSLPHTPTGRSEPQLQEVNLIYRLQLFGHVSLILCEKILFEILQWD